MAAHAVALGALSLVKLSVASPVDVAVPVDLVARLEASRHEATPPPVLGDRDAEQEPPERPSKRSKNELLRDEPRRGDPSHAEVQGPIAAEILARIHGVDGSQPADGVEATGSHTGLGEGEDQHGGGDPLTNASAEPRAPSLDGRLAANYPKHSSDLGIEGYADVEVQISPSGRASVLRIVSATEPEFGRACRRTVDGSQWQPARNRSGEQVARVVRYRCRFRME